MRELATVIILMAFVSVLAMIALSYEVHVVIKLAMYYEVDMITALGFKVVFGLIFIKGIVFYRSSNKMDEMDYAEKLGYVITTFFEGILNISLLWLIAWGASFIIN